MLAATRARCRRPGCTILAATRSVEIGIYSTVLWTRASFAHGYPAKRQASSFQLVCRGLTAYHALLMSRAFRGINADLELADGNTHSGRRQRTPRPIPPSMAAAILRPLHQRYILLFCFHINTILFLSNAASQYLNVSFYNSYSFPAQWECSRFDVYKSGQ